MRRWFALGIVLVSLVAGCSSSDPCAKASVLQQQIASKEKAAQTALDLSAAYAGQGDEAKSNEKGDRFVELQRQLGEEHSQLKALQAECLDS
jgi:hypothetical protein